MILTYGLTLRQPFAWAIAHSTKRIENRDWACWPAVIGQHVAIHVSVAETKTYYAWAKNVIFQRTGITVPLQSHHVRSAIVAVAKVTKCVEQDTLDALEYCKDPWWLGPYGWVLDDVHTLQTPVPCKGNFKLWRLSDEVMSQVREQLGVVQ